MMQSNHHPPKLQKRRLLMLQEQETRSIKLNHQRLWKKIRKMSIEDQIMRRENIKEKLINTINQAGHKNK